MIGPALSIDLEGIIPVEKTIVLGGVEIGKTIAKEEEIATIIAKCT